MTPATKTIPADDLIFTTFEVARRRLKEDPSFAREVGEAFRSGALEAQVRKLVRECKALEREMVAYRPRLAAKLFNREDFDDIITAAEEGSRSPFGRVDHARLSKALEERVDDLTYERDRFERLAIWLFRRTHPDAD